MKCKKLYGFAGLLSLILVGCSYLPVSFPDMGLENNQEPIGILTEGNTLKGESLLNETILIEHMITLEDGTKSKEAAEYTILDVQVYPNFLATKLPDDKRSKIVEDNSRYTLVPNPSENIHESEMDIPIDIQRYPVLLAKIKIKNISTQLDFHVDYVQLEYQNPDNKYLYSTDVLYFDKMLDDPIQAFHIPLKIGEETEITLVWPLSSKELDLENYFIDLDWTKKIPVTSLIEEVSWDKE